MNEERQLRLDDLRRAAKLMGPGNHVEFLLNELDTASLLSQIRKDTIAALEPRAASLYEAQGDFRRVCELIGSIHFHGHFKAGTANERELEMLLRKLGYVFETEEQLMTKLHPPLSAAKAAEMRADELEGEQG